MTKPDLQGFEPFLDLICDNFFRLPDGTISYKFFHTVRKANSHLDTRTRLDIIEYLFEIISNCEKLKNILVHFEDVQGEALLSSNKTPSP